MSYDGKRELKRRAAEIDEIKGKDRVTRWSSVTCNAVINDLFIDAYIPNEMHDDVVCTNWDGDITVDKIRYSFSHFSGEQIVVFGNNEEKRYTSVTYVRDGRLWVNVRDEYDFLPVPFRDIADELAKSAKKAREQAGRLIYIQEEFSIPREVSNSVTDDDNEPESDNEVESDGETE